MGFCVGGVLARISTSREFSSQSICTLSNWDCRTLSSSSNLFTLCLIFNSNLPELLHLLLVFHLLLSQLHRSNLLHLLLCSSSLISADCPGWFASKQAFKRSKTSCRQICTFWVHWLKNTHFLVTLTLIHNTLMAVWQNYLYIPKSPSS